MKTAFKFSPGIANELGIVWSISLLCIGFLLFLHTHIHVYGKFIGSKPTTYTSYIYKCAREGLCLVLPSAWSYTTQGPFCICFSAVLGVKTISLGLLGLLFSSDLDLSQCHMRNWIVFFCFLDLEHS